MGYNNSRKILIICLAFDLNEIFDIWEGWQLSLQEKQNYDESRQVQFLSRKKNILDLKVFQLLFEETSKHRLRYNCGRRNVIIKELFRITILPRHKYHIDKLFRFTISPRRKYHIVRYFAFLVELVSTSERPIFFDLFSNDCISLPEKFKRIYLKEYTYAFWLINVEMLSPSPQTHTS